MNLLQEVFLESCEPRVFVLCSFQIQLDVHHHNLPVAMDSVSLKMLRAMVWTIVETTAMNTIAVCTYHSCISTRVQNFQCTLPSGTITCHLSCLAHVGYLEN